MLEIEKLLEGLAKEDAERRAKEPKQPDDPIAPEGKLWVCGACGKTATNRYGEEGGWDESCMLNSGLHDVDKLVYQGRRVVEIKS